MTAGEGNPTVADWPLVPGARPDAYAHLQWKGTDACMDIDCLNCGVQAHFDGLFAYTLTCPECGMVHELTSFVGYRAVGPSHEHTAGERMTVDDDDRRGPRGVRWRNP